VTILTTGQKLINKYQSALLALPLKPARLDVSQLHCWRPYTVSFGMPESLDSHNSANTLYCSCQQMLSGRRHQTVIPFVCWILIERMIDERIMWLQTKPSDNTKHHAAYCTIIMARHLPGTLRQRHRMLRINRLQPAGYWMHQHV
jgi:hypothetical protein